MILLIIIQIYIIYSIIINRKYFFELSYFFDLKSILYNNFKCKNRYIVNKNIYINIDKNWFK